MGILTEKKIVKPATLRGTILKRKKEGKTIAFTNGCFDILHAGHISYLERASKFADFLVLGLNSDKSVKKIKGRKRPIVPEDNRAKVVAALKCVDYVCLFDEETPENLIQYLKPDVLIKGADWKGKKIAGENFIKSIGGKVKYMEFVPRCSSTNIIETILKKCKK